MGPVLALVAFASGFMAHAPVCGAARPSCASPVVLRAQEATEKAAATLAAAVITLSAGVFEANAAPATFEAAPATSTLPVEETTDWTAADFDTGYRIERLAIMAQQAAVSVGRERERAEGASELRQQQAEHAPREARDTAAEQRAAAAWPQVRGEHGED